MSTSARYTHPPLPTPHYIRLLEFPAYTDQNEPLHGTLRVVDLQNSTVPYVALSYTWGRPNFSEDLLLDGKGIFGITPNLAAALRRFRYSSALRWIWVDAICINQQDDEEKTKQIPLMGDIYRGASRVMVWLGDRAQDITLLRQIKHFVGRITNSSVENVTANELVAALSQLGCLPWFSRRWIIQELVLNPNAVLCCGQMELPWVHLAPAFQVIQDKKTTNVQNIQLLWDLWRDVAMPFVTWNKNAHHELLRKRDMATLMDSCSAFECLDDHDRIAALIGLSTDAGGIVTVNYADTVEQTFISFAEGLARNGHMAWLIYQSSQRQRDPSLQGQILPSWVPDWRAAISTHCQTSKLDTKDYKRTPCDIQMYSSSPCVHLLTAKFLTWVDQAAASDNCFRTPGNRNAAPLRVAWKSALFPKEADLAERLALTLVDLWPWVRAHLSEHEMAFIHDIWCELLAWLSHYLTHPPQYGETYPGDSLFGPNKKRSGIPDFKQDANGLQTLRTFTTDWVRDLSKWAPRKKRGQVLVRDDFLIFCTQTSQSGILARGLPCAIGGVQLPFYHAVEIGDKAMLADLGRFHFPYNDSAVEHGARHIVREHTAVDGLSIQVVSRAQSVNNPRGTNEVTLREGLPGFSKSHISEDITPPVVYEFVAPCDLHRFFRWRELVLYESRSDDLMYCFYTRSPFDIFIQTLSVWIK